LGTLGTLGPLIAGGLTVRGVGERFSIFGVVTRLPRLGGVGNDGRAGGVGLIEPTPDEMFGTVPEGRLGNDEACSRRESLGPGLVGTLGEFVAPDRFDLDELKRSRNS
jgi:hypothetical protein